MHTFLIVIAVIVFIIASVLLRPRGPGSLADRVNRVAWRRNAEGRGTLLTKPIWGKRARPPKGFDESDRTR